MSAKRSRQEPTVHMEGWVYDGYILRVDDMNSTLVDQPYYGTVIDTRTSKVVHEIYGKYFFRVMGQLNIWLNQQIIGD